MSRSSGRCCAASSRSSDSSHAARRIGMNNGSVTGAGRETLPRRTRTRQHDLATWVTNRLLIAGPAARNTVSPGRRRTSNRRPQRQCDRPSGRAQATLVTLAAKRQAVRTRGVLAVKHDEGCINGQVPAARKGRHARFQLTAAGTIAGDFWLGELGLCCQTGRRLHGETPRTMGILAGVTVLAPVLSMPLGGAAQRTY